MCEYVWMDAFDLTVSESLSIIIYIITEELRHQDFEKDEVYDRKNYSLPKKE